MPTFLFDTIVFGPVSSRRLGASLGINLLPENAKLCNFDCIYCECGRNADNKPGSDFLHTRSTVSFHLYNKLKQMKEDNDPLDVITFAGNGEPTLHPEFAHIIDDTLDLRDRFFPNVRIAVLSNATRIHIPNVFNALKKVDDNILKLDTANPQTLKILNNPPSDYSIPQTIKHMQAFNGDFTMQTMFVQGYIGHTPIDNSTAAEVTAWLQLVKQARPAQVMIYTIARDTPTPGLHKVSPKRLHEIARQVQAAGFETRVST